MATSAIVAAQIGIGIDAKPTPSWWVITIGAAAISAVMASMAVNTSLAAQAKTERNLRTIAQQAWFDLGPIKTRERAGKLLDLATNGAMRAGRYKGGVMASTIGQLTAPIMVVIVIGLWIDWKSAGLLALVLVVGPLAVGAFQGATKPVGSRFRASQTHLRQIFLENIQALESLAYANAAGRASKELAEENEAHRKRIMRLLGGNQLLILVMDIAFSMTAMLIATYAAVSDDMTVGQGISLLLLTTILINPVDLVGQFFYIGIGGRAAMGQFAELHAEATDARSEEPDRKQSDANSPVLSLEHVNAGWTKGEPIITDLSLRLEKGEKVALVGPSGVGKSTVSAIIQGLLKPTSGKISVNARDIAVVQQRPFLFTGTIADNLQMAKPGANFEEMTDALHKAGFSDTNELPEGINTNVGERGALLSGGQAQRVAIAQALLMDAPLLILDEPTSQVDLQSEARILNALNQAMEGRTVLMIAHRRAAISGADRVIGLVRGLEVQN